MIAAQVMIPCMSSAPACRLDWTAISAVATFLAVLAALLVGILPIALKSYSRREQAKLLGMVAVDDLLVQELHIRAAVQVPTTVSKVVTSWDYEQVNKCVQMLNPRSAVELIPFSELLPRKVRVALSQAVTNISAAEQRRVFLLAPEPGAIYDLSGDVTWYEEVSKTLLDLRRELCAWLSLEVVDESAGSKRLAEILRLTAAQDRDAWVKSKGAPAHVD